MNVSKGIQYRKVHGLVGDQSFSIVLPKSYATALGVGKGDFVKVYQLEDHRILIDKARDWKWKGNSSEKGCDVKWVQKRIL